MTSQPMTNSRLSRRHFAALAAAVGATSLSTSLYAQESTPEPQATPSASPVAATEATVQTLISADVDMLPPAPYTVRLLRINMDAGTINPFHTHHGPEISVIESGEMKVASQGTAFVTRADGTAEELTDAETTLATGDTIHFPAEVAMYYENATDAPNTMLNAVAIPVGSDYANERITYLDGRPDLTGLTYQKLGDGLVQSMEQQAATWTVDRIDLPPAVEVPAVTGVGMITPLQGNFSFTIDAGGVQVTRHDSNMLQPNAVIGSGFSLTDGDAAFFPNGLTATGRPEEQQPLSYLAMNIEPANGVPEGPATITFTAGDGTVAHGAPVDVTGRIVTTNSDGVNMRAEASVNADVVDQIDQGIEMEVLGGPVEADDYVWYEVRVTAEGGSQGWMVSEFLDGLDDEQQTSSEDDGTSGETEGDDAETPEAAGTPAATGDFAVGSTVVTIEEGVRIRPAATTEGEPIDALPMGTELTVVSGPVDADDFTWIEVETPQGWTGWVVTDFVEPQD